jgi:predicted ATPase/class 3 adenylate cyclase
VTVFLFTDLEGSTRLWERHPTEMAAALAHHDALLLEAVTSSGGTVVKTTGDGLMAVFASVADCVAACLAAQRRLGAETWATTVPLRVRMGVNAGDAEARDGDYHGTAVNRAARIMAVGHGGQVLLSESAAALVDGALPSGASLLDLGIHRLKDLTEPEHLFQLCHPDVAVSFPPLRSLDARPNNLPVQVSEFFGRQAELAAIRAMVAQPGVRLVTLTGPGGTGKTRLALQVGAEVVERYRDGVYFVDLSAEREPEGAFEAMARDMALSSAGEGATFEVLKARLRDRELLVILDNFEQVTEAAPGVAQLLGHCPGLVALVTSREALRVRGEQVFPVPPLTVPDPGAPFEEIAAAEAVQLFTERARSVLPGFALTEANAAAVAEISGRLDGLPLAIELAAPRLTVFTTDDLRDRLDRQLDVLRGGARDLPTRQRTLRGTIEWSYELLAHDERRLFVVMSVFSGARLVAVEAVMSSAGEEVDVVDVLTSLVDKSLVRSVTVGGSHRFTMLRTIGDFAAEKLQGSPELQETAKRAHAVFYADQVAGLAPALDGPRRDLVLEELDTEIGNLRAAWQYWVEATDHERLQSLLNALWVYHDLRGWYHGAAGLSGDLLAVLATTAPSAARDEEEMTLRVSLARALMTVHGYTPEVDAEFARVFALASQPGATITRVSILRALATYHMNIMENEKTAELGRQLLAVAEREGRDATRVEGHLVTGLGTAFGGDLREGLRHLDRAADLFSPEMHGTGHLRLGTSPGVVSRIVSALLRWMGGWTDRARADAAEAVELARKLNHPYSQAYAFYHVGYLELARRDLVAARRWAGELRTVADDNEYPIWRALASVLEGVALCGLGDPDEGLTKTEAGYGLYQVLTTPPVFWAPFLALRSQAFALAGQAERALELIDEAIDFAGSKIAGYPDFWVQRGDYLAMSLEPEAAAIEQCYRSAIDGARMSGLRLIELMATTRLVRLLRDVGAGADERDALATLYETFDEGLNEPELVTARELLGLH